MTEYASGHSTWRGALQRVWRGLRQRGRGRRPGWSIGVPVIAVAAGLLFTTSATSADGTPLRQDRRIALTELVAERQDRVAEAEAEAEALAAEVSALTADLAGSDASVVNEQARAEQSHPAAGLSDLRGPGMTVTLSDALRPDGVAPPGAQPDDLLVHQQDLQAIVNALWAGGAEAMTIMGVRIIATSAVICVGPVLLLHGRPYSPPYEIAAIGDPDTMRAALAVAPGVQLYREAVAAYGLGYRETVEEDIIVPAFEGTSTLRNSRVPR